MPSPFFDGLGETVLDIFSEEVDATFKPQSGDPQFVQIIFNDRWQETDRDGKPYGSEKPMAWSRTDSICPEPINGDIITINGNDYIIRAMEPDGLEITKMVISDKVS